MGTICYFWGTQPRNKIEKMFLVCVTILAIELTIMSAYGWYLGFSQENNCFSQNIDLKIWVILAWIMIAFFTVMAPLILYILCKDYFQI